MHRIVDKGTAPIHAYTLWTSIGVLTSLFLGLTIF